MKLSKAMVLEIELEMELGMELEMEREREVRGGVGPFFLSRAGG